jgi:hypothetical protein
MSLLCATALSACVTAPQPAAPQMNKFQLAPVSAELMEPVVPNYRLRLLSFFSEKPTEQTAKPFALQPSSK